VDRLFLDGSPYSVKQEPCAFLLNEQWCDVCENALQDYIRRLEGPVYRNVNESNPSHKSESEQNGAGGGIRARFYQ
jgi:hypothetical protein